MQTSPFDRSTQLFSGISFVLLGFDPIKKSQLYLQVSRELVNGGALDAGQYGPNCTHVIVDKLVYDDSVCVAARRDGKILVSSLWIDHSFDVGTPVDTTSIMYRPVRDLNGIPGAKSLVICLTGYQREDREDIMTMVGLMGAQFSKPLIANKVTHLICYKFEGEKYLLAKKMKKIKLINHLWLEDCLKAWEIVSESDYSKSGYELEMEAEAKDSEDEPEGVTARQNERKIATPPHSLLKTSASKVFMTSTSNQFLKPHETKNKHVDTENVIDSSCGPSNLCEKTVGSFPKQSQLISASTLANKSPQNEVRNIVSPTKTTSPTMNMKSCASTAKRLNTFTLNDSFNNDVESAAQESSKDHLPETSSAQNRSCNTPGRKSLSSKGKNVICDEPISKLSTTEIEDLDAVQRPQKKYKETSLAANFDNRDVGMVEKVTRSPSVVSSDLQKSSNQNLETSQLTGGSASKSVKRKSISKKFSPPNRTKKNTVNEKGSTSLKNNVPRNDNGLQIENMPWHKSLCMDDETEPPEDKDESNKEKYEDREPDNTVDVVMEEKRDENLHDVDQLTENLGCETTSRGNLTKNGKKKTARSVKKKELVSDRNNKKPEIREESTPNRATRSKRNANDLEDSMEVKVAEDVCNDADMETENVVNKKETKRNERPVSKTKVSVKEVTDVKAVNKKGKRTASTCDLEPQEENMQAHVDDQSTGEKEVVKSGKDEPMWFILTGHRFQRREFQQMIRRLKGRVCIVTHRWSYQATHFIVPGPVLRTEKFFAAAASGRWILKTDYLTASNDAGKFLAEEPYEWHKSDLTEDGQINLEAPRKWRLLKERTGHGAFYGMKIIVYGECITPPLDTLKRVVKAGDGTILATSPPYTRFLNTGIDFAVVSPGMPHVDIWVQEFLKHEIPCVYADYLVEYVCKPGYPLEKHVQYDTNVWAERSYNKLMQQLEEETSEPKTPDGDDVACEVCGSRDQGEEMLICGDEGGLVGCGVGTHIDCCDPPLEDVPDEDWFCVKCSKKPKSKSSKRKCYAARG
ncbi:BRCT domain-containing protein At4g02110-like [Bidens hawaiensis]|uniref:BRCT domain-containing protein At4g02110-like n=1 Tax=Bidens hawaiensis TaxID=980011 RepID=UPI00404B02B7